MSDLAAEASMRGFGQLDILTNKTMIMMIMPIVFMVLKTDDDDDDDDDDDEINLGRGGWSPPETWSRRGPEPPEQSVKIIILMTIILLL